MFLRGFIQTYILHLTQTHYMFLRFEALEQYSYCLLIVSRLSLSEIRWRGKSWQLGNHHLIILVTHPNSIFIWLIFFGVSIVYFATKSTLVNTTPLYRRRDNTYLLWNFFVVCLIKFLEFIVLKIWWYIK